MEMNLGVFTACPYPQIRLILLRERLAKPPDSGIAVWNAHANINESCHESLAIALQMGIPNLSNLSMNLNIAQMHLTPICRTLQQIK